MTAKRVYTTAPEAYDRFSTRTVDAQAGTDQRGESIRVVTMEERDYGWQTGRYMSGLYAAFDEALAQEMFEDGLWQRARPEIGDRR